MRMPVRMPSSRTASGRSGVSEVSSRISKKRSAEGTRLLELGPAPRQVAQRAVGGLHHGHEGGEGAEREAPELAEDQRHAAEQHDHADAVVDPLDRRARVARGCAARAGCAGSSAGSRARSASASPRWARKLWITLMPDRIWSRRCVTSLWLSWRRLAEVRIRRPKAAITPATIGAITSSDSVSCQEMNTSTVAPTSRRDHRSAPRPGTAGRGSGAPCGRRSSRARASRRAPGRDGSGAAARAASRRAAAAGRRARARAPTATSTSCPTCASGSTSTISSAPSRMRGSARLHLGCARPRAGPRPPATRPAPPPRAPRARSRSRGDPPSEKRCAALLVRQDHFVEDRLEQPGPRGAGAGVHGGQRDGEREHRRGRGARSGRGASRPGRLPGAGAVASGWDVVELPGARTAGG